MIAVALDSNTCREDVMSLLNYGFANYMPTQAVPQGTPLGTVNVSTAAAPVPVQASADVQAVVSRWHPVPEFHTALLPLPTLPPAPIAAGTKLGTFTVLVDGKVQASGDAVAAQDVGLKPALALMKTTKVGRPDGVPARLRAARCCDAVLYGSDDVCPRRDKKGLRPQVPRPASRHVPPVEHGERLQKLLASAGIGSRRACEAWIEQGRVRVNGQVVTELGTKVSPDRDKVTFDGRRGPPAVPPLLHCAEQADRRRLLAQ